MGKSLLLYSDDFKINFKKLFKADGVHLIYINAEVLNNATHKNNKLMSELVRCLFKEYNQLTLVTNYVPAIDHMNLLDERTLAFILETNNIKQTYELSDFHAAVLSHITSHQLLLESQIFLKKELLSSQLSKASNNIKLLSALMDDYDVLISKSKSILDKYKEDIILRFGFKNHIFINQA